MQNRGRFVSAISLLLSVFMPTVVSADTHHVWEKVELVFTATGDYDNPYTDVDVWVQLRGPGFNKRCYGFWDGSKTFRVRVLATKSGRWTWESGANVPDAGLTGKKGSFTAIPWSEDERDANPCRRGFIQATSNGHAFQYADGTPCFLLGDTWWATPTFRFRWYDDDKHRPWGPEAGFKDYVRLRRKQEFNCIAMIAAFPNWADDGKPARWKADDGTVLRMAWPRTGTKLAKDMPNERGDRAFKFPGKIPGYEEYLPDLERINPRYFQTMDKKIDYLNEQGIIPFIEVARRDIGQVWQKFYPWPDSYARYMQYVWSRYQANNCLFSPIHFDTPAASIPVEQWNAAAHLVLDRYGPPPFGTLRGTNSNPSSLRNWGHVDQAKWLDFHQIGNRRTHDVYQYLTEIFNTRPPVPAINGEPYYDGMENAQPGSAKAARYCRSAMYGSFLSGGLGGHIYGAGGWSGGLWSGEVEPESKYPIWQVIQWQSADQMRHLKTFAFSEGDIYQRLQPATDLVSPRQSGPAKSLSGWAYCAASNDRNLLLLYFEQNCPCATISKLPPNTHYDVTWFDPRTGQWLDDQRAALSSNSQGKLTLPEFPDKAKRARTDWALKLKKQLQH